MVGYIYKITNCVNGKVYVGQTIAEVRSRFASHKRNARKNTNPFKITKAIAKYGEENFIVETLVEVPCEWLDAAEVAFISVLRATDSRYGYNINAGGSGFAEWKSEKISKKLLGRPSWNKGKKGTPAWNKGLPWSDEVKARLRGPRRPLTEEHRAKLRKVRTPEQIQAKIDARTARREAARVKRVERMTGERNPFFGKSHSPEVLQKMSVAATGRPSWNKGISPSQETRAKIADTLKGQTPWNLGVAATDEHKKRLSESHKGKRQPLELVAKRTDKIRGVKRTPEQRRNISEACRGRVNSDEHKQACRDAVKALWANPEYREKMLRSRREKATLRKEA